MPPRRPAGDSGGDPAAAPLDPPSQPSSPRRRRTAPPGQSPWWLSAAAGARTSPGPGAPSLSPRSRLASRRPSYAAAGGIRPARVRVTPRPRFAGCCCRRAAAPCQIPCSGYAAGGSPPGCCSSGGWRPGRVALVPDLVRAGALLPSGADPLLSHGCSSLSAEHPGWLETSEAACGASAPLRGLAGGWPSALASSIWGLGVAWWGGRGPSGCERGVFPSPSGG